jgi:hypothetical protein
MAVRAGVGWSAQPPPVSAAEIEVLRAAWLDDAALWRADGDGVDVLAGASARALRQLPGLGAARATELARARWEQAARPDGLALRDVPGIGEATEREVASALGLEVPAGGLWIRR